MQRSDIYSFYTIFMFIQPVKIIEWKKNQPPIANFWKTFGAKDHLTSMNAIFKIWEDPFILYIGRSYDGHKILETFLE